MDLIIIDLEMNEPVFNVLGMDMEKPYHPSNPILAFNKFASTNFEDLLLVSNALLANNGVFVILRPFWNKHYNDKRNAVSRAIQVINASFTLWMVLHVELKRFLF